MSDIFLSRIAIRDFRTFGEFEIEVPAAPGLVLLTGTNGLGKSNFFDAIEWGLTNKIRRFDPYLPKGKKKLEEKDYLTRRGAEPGSHSVSLTFSGNDPIERSVGAGSSMEDIITLLARPDSRTINDLGTYLALTHFLGQTGQQRFTSRNPQDQWEALKGPSGIARLERIRNGLRGRPTVSAFTRRLEEQQRAVDEIGRQIADWQGWMIRLKRLRSALRATGAMTAVEVEEGIARLGSDLLKLTSDKPVAISGEDIGRRLEVLADHLSETVRVFGERKAKLDAVAPLPGQFAVNQDEARKDHPTLVRLRSRADGAHSRLKHATKIVESANEAVAAQNSAIATIEQNIVVLDAVRTDLARREQLAKLIAVDLGDRRALTNTIAECREKIRSADAVINQHSEAVAEVARLSSVAASARETNMSMANCLELEERAKAAAAVLSLSQKVAESVKSKLIPLNERQIELQSQTAVAERERTEVKRHSTAISAALSQLASHLHHEDADCPVCQTRFEPGALKVLAVSAAAASDSKLAKADDVLEALRTAQADVTADITSLQDQIATFDQNKKLAEEAGIAANHGRAAIARILEVVPESDLAAVSATRVSDAQAIFAAAKAALDPLAANAAAAIEQRSSSTTSLSELIESESQIEARLLKLQGEDAACADRIAARNLSSATIAELETSITAARNQVEGARAQLAKLTDSASAALANVEREQTAFDAAERDLAAAELTRENAEKTSLQMIKRWNQSGFAGTPSQNEYDSRIKDVDTAIANLRVLKERQLKLASDNEDALLRSEMDEIISSMQASGGEGGVDDPSKYLAVLEGKLETARELVKLTKNAQKAVKNYSEELKSQADDFSNRVLDPLNTVIDDFNEAMLSTPGESIQFKANTRVDSTSFGMALSYRERVENAIEAKKGLPPQVVLSEGQLAANGFSILCAASTAYPWSRWRSLLLDDPLQHNDIIHSAAFIDVMRNMVELNGYQLIMSSHDRGESDFIARKFDAAGLPCSTVLLTGPSDKGVVWESPEQNQAAARILGENSDIQSADSA